MSGYISFGSTYIRLLREEHCEVPSVPARELLDEFLFVLPCLRSNCGRHSASVLLVASCNRKAKRIGDRSRSPCRVELLAMLELNVEYDRAREVAGSDVAERVLIGSWSRATFS